MPKYGLSSPSKAQLVRDAITTEIAKVPNIGATGSDWTLWMNESRLPAAYTILETDEKERGPTQSKTVRAHFRVPTILATQTPENDFDDLRAAIEDQIEDDPTLGGLVFDCWVSGCGSFATAKAISGEVYVRDIFVEAEYRHDRAAA